ncbi:hypothetical protein FS763_14580 [Agrobacterium vitis]|nr:hypothetical protein [Allorhizobium ampelinum]
MRGGSRRSERKRHGNLHLSSKSKGQSDLPCAAFAVKSGVACESMSRKSVQRFCGNDMRKNKNLKRVA